MTELVESLTAQTPAPAPVADAPVPSEDDSLGAAFDRIMTNNGADRADNGRFVSPNADSDPDPASLGGEEGAGADDPALPSPVEEVAPAPANWNGLDDAWKALPVEHREKVKTHFDDLHRRMSDQGRQLSAVKPIADHIAQATKAIPLFQGMSPDQVSEKALEMAAIAVSLKRDPVNTLLQVAQNTGQLKALAERLSGQSAEGQGNEILGLKQEIASLKQQLHAASDPTQIETHVSRVFEGRAAQEAVNQFASDPANSFFADVEPHLPGFIPIARAQAGDGASTKDVLKAAYDMAVHAIPEIRSKIEAAARTAAAANDQKRSEAAKKAASINVKSTSTGAGREVSEAEALASAYDRAMAG